MDEIRLSGLAATGYHGVFDHERRTGQEFSVDVVLGADLKLAGQSDDLADTIDYGVVAEKVHARITGEPFDLIERLAQVIADDILTDVRVAWVEVSVHKPKAPITVAFSDCVVRIRREQS